LLARAVSWDDEVWMVDYFCCVAWLVRRIELIELARVGNELALTGIWFFAVFPSTC
jgi:hypothetical protein